MPVTFTTDAPDVETLSLDASVVEELTATWEADLNNGEYRLELRDDDPDGDHPPYELETTVPFDGTLEHVIDGILGGEQYSVRVRAETEFATGNWLAAEEITKLIASDSITFDAVGETSVDLAWTINNDFRGSHQVFRRRADYDYDGGQGRLVGSVASDSSSFVDDSVAPDREYEYEVRTLTQWQYADSDPASTTTSSIGLEDRAVPPRGWHAEVDHPSGTTLTPEILDGAVRRPTVNGFPRVELPSPYRERWHSDAVDDASLRVWHDADREPIEILEHRSLEEGSGSKRTVLEGRGGTQLDRRVVEDVDIQPTHEFVRDLIDEYTDYNYNVDDPQVDQESVTLQAADTDLELEQAVAEAVREALADETVPFTITDDGTIEPLQTCWWIQGEDIGGASSTSNDEFSGGQGADLDSSSAGIGSAFSNEHTIPAGKVGVHIREGVYSDNPAYDLLIGGTNYARIPGTFGSTSIQWTDFEVWTDVNPQLDPGSHTLEFNQSAFEDGAFIFDAVVIYDKRYHDPADFDNEVHEAGGHLDSPPEFAEAIPIELEPITTPLAISDLTLKVTMDNGADAPELALRSNGTGSWDTATDASSHTISYSDLSTTAAARVSVGYDDTLSPRDQTPRLGYEGQALDSLSLEATLDSTPVLTDRSFDANLIDVLREVADIGNFVFEVRESSSGTTLEWTQIDQRPVDIDPDLADYSIDRQTEDVLERAIVYGGAQRITRQSVDVATGEWVDLPFPDSRLVEGKETLYDGDTEFSRSDDYDIRYATQDGQPQLKALSDGSLPDGQTVSVDADVKPRGEFAAGDVVDEATADTETYDMPGLASKQMCDQVALFLVEETGDALIEAEVTVPHSSVEWSVIEAIDPEQLPTDEPMQVREIESNPSETTLRLASRQSVGEAVQEIRERTQLNSQRV